MGLRDTIAAAVNTAFQAVGDIPLDVVYTSKTGTTRDPSTGASTSVETVLNMQAVLARFKAEEFPQVPDANQGGQKMIAKVVDFHGVTPNIKTDSITISGVDWTPIWFSTDPASSIYTFLIRQR
jgi:hypothetical protein